MDPDKATNSGDKTDQSKKPETITSAVRLQRNQAEKQRRDRLNGYISELATLVPMVKNSSKPVDKVSVLRLAAAHMRLNISCLNPARFKSKLSFLPSTITSYLEILEKNIGGFIVATTFSGTVVFCSKSVEDFLGYQNIDFMGQSIFNYVPGMENAQFLKKVNSVIARYRKGYPKAVSKSLVLHFQKRPLPRTNDICYQKVLIRLSIHSNDFQNHPTKEDNIPVKGGKIMKHKDFGTSALILMFIEPLMSTPKIPMPLSPKQHDVYVTLHGIRGEIIEADHNISTITGYMPCDVLGKSAYEYIFETDVPIAQFAQKAMFTSNDGKGIITYRLKTFNMKYIFLQSTGFLFKDSANEIQRFICYNRWLSNEEGESELKKFQDRFSPASFAARQLEAQKNNTDSEVVCLNSPEENNKTINILDDVSFSEQHSNGLQWNSNNLSISVPKHTKSLKSPSMELNDGLNGNGSHKENGYVCNQPLQMKKYDIEINEVEMDINLNQSSLGNGYDKEKKDECSYYQSTDLILEENYVKKEKRKYDSVPQSLNSYERMQDLCLMQYSNSFAKDDYDHAYLNTGNEYTLFQEEKSVSFADVQLQDPYNTQTKLMPSSVKPPAGYSYQKLPSDHHSKFVNLMPSHMSVYKVTENVSYNNMGIQDDQYDSTSSIVPFTKTNLKSLSIDQCNSKVKILDDDCAHQNNNSYHLNSLENGANLKIQSSKLATYNNNFSPNGDSMYSNIDKYGNDLTNHNGFQKFCNTKNGIHCSSKSMNYSVVDNSNNSCVFSSLPCRDRRELLNKSLDSKNRNTSFNVEVINSKDSKFQCNVFETYSETVTRNDTFCEEPTNQSSITIPSNHESSFDSSVNQELYHELDMFFANFP